jgi:hypothetical protein
VNQAATLVLNKHDIAAGAGQGLGSAHEHLVLIYRNSFQA